MLITILYLFLILFTSINRPFLSIALASNAFIINAINGSLDGVYFVLNGAVGPAVCFTVIVLRCVLIKRGFHAKFREEGALVFFIFLGMLVSSSYSHDIYLSINNSIRFLFLCASYFYIIRIALQNSSYIDVEDIFIANLLVGALASTYLIFFGTSSSEYITRMTINDVSPVPISIAIGQSMVIAIFKFSKATDKMNSFAFLLLIVLLGYALLLTNTRSTVISIAFVFLYLLIMSLFVLNGNAFRRLMFVSSLIVTGFIFILMYYSDTILRLVDGLLSIYSGQLGESSSDRVVAWGNAMEMFFLSPLLGAGTGSTAQFYLSYPHNVFLELLSENGLFVTILFVLLVSKALSCTVKANSPLVVLLGGLFLFNFIIAQVSLTLWMHKQLFIWFSLLIYFSRVNCNSMQCLEENG